MAAGFVQSAIDAGCLLRGAGDTTLTILYPHISAADARRVEDAMATVVCELEARGAGSRQK
jgi:hypothetical protein